MLVLGGFLESCRWQGDELPPPLRSRCHAACGMARTRPSCIGGGRPRFKHGARVRGPPPQCDFLLFPLWCSIMAGPFFSSNLVEWCSIVAGGGDPEFHTESVTMSLFAYFRTPESRRRGPFHLPGEWPRRHPRLAAQETTPRQDHRHHG